MQNDQIFILIINIKHILVSKFEEMELILVEYNAIFKIKDEIKIEQQNKVINV